MKTKFRLISQVAVAALALAAAGQISGLISFPRPTLSSLLGGLTAVSVVAIALSDYARKPSFRVRRQHSDANSMASGSHSDSGDAALDWTYSTHAG